MKYDTVACSVCGTPLIIEEDDYYLNEKPVCLDCYQDAEKSEE